MSELGLAGRTSHNTKAVHTKCVICTDSAVLVVHKNEMSELSNGTYLIGGCDDDVRSSSEKVQVYPSNEVWSIVKTSSAPEWVTLCTVYHVVGSFLKG